MATILSKYNEIDELGGGRFRLTQMLKDHCHRDANGYWRRNVNDFVNSGIVGRPHLVSTAPFMVSVNDEGHRRIHPTNDPLRYLEVGTPYVKPAAQWVKVGFSNATRTGNTITWSRAQANLSIAMGGHFINWECELLGGYSPGQVALPVNLVGLTRTGDTIFADGVPVMFLSKPVMRDAANSFDVRPITHSFVSLQGQPYLLLTLPSLTGMTRPVIDPTLTLQPDAAAGIDTELLSLYPTINRGTSATISIGEANDAADIMRVLIKFDLSSLPDNATLTTNTLSLYCLTDYSENARTVRVFRQKRAWLEGTQGWGTGTGATWNKYDTTNDWQTAGAFGANDCEQTDIGSRAFTATETVNAFKDFVLTPTTKATLDLGNGWLIKSDTETNDRYDYASSDGATAGQRPKLVTVYTVPSFIPGIMRHHFIPSQLGGR